MINIFNREELAITFRMDEQAAWRSALAAAGVDYRVKVTDRNSPSALSDTRAKTGTAGQMPDINREYTLYVKRSEIERARAAIGHSGKMR